MTHFDAGLASQSATRPMRLTRCSGEVVWPVFTTTNPLRVTCHQCKALIAADLKDGIIIRPSGTPS